MITATMHGEREVLRKFRQLERVGARRAVRKAVRAGAAPQVKEYRRNVPRETGLLKKAVFQRIKSYRGGAYVLAVVGARAKKDPATGRNPAKYAHLVEGGTRPHRIPKLPGKRLKFDAGGALIIRAAVAHPGGAAQRPLERAYRTSKPEALRNFRGKFAAEVIAEAKRA